MTRRATPLRVVFTIAVAAGLCVSSPRVSSQRATVGERAQAEATVQSPAKGAAPAGLDDRLQALWEADTVEEADAQAKLVRSLGPSFDVLFDHLTHGLRYSTQKTGRVDMPSSDPSGAFDHVVEVPEDYTPSKRWPVRVLLHGGVGRERPTDGSAPRPLANRLPGAGAIVLMPRAWGDSGWWTDSGTTHVLDLLAAVKRRYNVDESRAHLTGISDGGTGVYYMAMRVATPWSACLALNGQPLVIANEQTGVEGELFSHNMVNCPLYMVNGGKDPLYPASSMQPLVNMFKAGGIPLVFRVYPDAGHDVSWWPQERPRFEAFVESHPRVAHPDSISWETGRADKHNRFRWLVIDRLGGRASDMKLADVNRYDAPAGLSRTLFSRRSASGRVDVVRKGNAFVLETRGVRDLTLLLSPDVVDFSAPIVVTVNGRKVHDGRVAPNVATLLKWTARDRDRTMLYGAELPIAVP